MKEEELKDRIIRLSYQVIEKLGGDMFILSPYGSYQDTMDTEEIVEMIEHWLFGDKFGTIEVLHSVESKYQRKIRAAIRAFRNTK